MQNNALDNSVRSIKSKKAAGATRIVARSVAAIGAGIAVIVLILAPVFGHTKNNPLSMAWWLGFNVDRTQSRTAHTEDTEQRVFNEMQRLAASFAVKDGAFKQWQLAPETYFKAIELDTNVENLVLGFADTDVLFYENVGSDKIHIFVDTYQQANLDVYKHGDVFEMRLAGVEVAENTALTGTVYIALPTQVVQTIKVQLQTFGASFIGYDDFVKKINLTNIYNSRGEPDPLQHSAS